MKRIYGLTAAGTLSVLLGGCGATPGASTTTSGGGTATTITLSGRLAATGTLAF